MTQKLYKYVPWDGLPEGYSLLRWFEKDRQPPRIIEGGVQYELVRDRPRDRTHSVPVIREWIRSVQLPKHWPYAKHHDATGACIFENETEAREACKRARDHGEPVAWDR